MPAVFETDLSSKFAGADFTGKQYNFVKLDASNLAVPTSAVGDRIFGVIQNEPKAGQEALIKTDGNTKVVASAALALDVFVGTTAGSLARPAATGNFARGVVVTPASALNDIAVIQLTRTQIVTA